MRNQCTTERLELLLSPPLANVVPLMTSEVMSETCSPEVCLFVTEMARVDSIPIGLVNPVEEDPTEVDKCSVVDDPMEVSNPIVVDDPTVDDPIVVDNSTVDNPIVVAEPTLVDNKGIVFTFVVPEVGMTLATD